MSTLIKSPTFPSLKSMMEDLWNSETLFDRAVLKNEGLPCSECHGNRKEL